MWGTRQQALRKMSLYFKIVFFYLFSYFQLVFQLGISFYVFPDTPNISVPGDSALMLLKCMCNNVLIEKK